MVDEKPKAGPPELEDEPIDPLHERWGLIAIIIGNNELAKRAETFGSRIYFRLHCQEAEKRLVELGGEVILTEGQPTLLQLGDGMPYINLYERDIELMRAAVLEFDRKAAER